MSSYLFDKNDGKIHTRYSELIRCTPGAIERVLDERFGVRQAAKTADMQWGSDRHDMWRDESLETGMVPQCFNEVGMRNCIVEHIEQEFVVEMYPGVVIHFRPDAVSVKTETIFDYKTALEPEGKEIAQGSSMPVVVGDNNLTVLFMNMRKTYERSRQLKFYAFLLGIHGIRMRRGLYLIEAWNRDHTAIIGYTKAEQNYKMADLAKIIPWTQERVALLVAAVKQREGMMQNS